MSGVREFIEEGKAVLGIEFGSTRIKAVLIDGCNNPIAAGSHEWENRLENGVWTYSEEDIITGLKSAYTSMAQDARDKYGVEITSLAAMGVSGMMHGYIALDENDSLLVPFRTWRNTVTGEASAILTKELGFHIPQRWSAAHLYQAILNGEEHTGRIKYLTTLAGYIHYRLTGKKVMGIGEASGMFPIDSAVRDYDAAMLDRFNALAASKGFDTDIRDILPKVLVAGECAGTLTKDGAALLDASGRLKEGVKLCPPEGDAGTGMVATNSVKPRTGNVSAGTSVFAMIVLEKELSKPYSEIDLVTTPAGDLVGMVHCNNCTSDLNAWVNVFGEFASLAGVDIPKWKLYDLLYFEGERGDKDCGGLLSYNYVSSENITEVNAGRPLFVRTHESKFTLANMMRAHLYSAFGTLKMGCDIMLKEEGVKLDRITGHGGIFKTERVGQSFLAAALGVPVTLMKTAGEGGAWGMAVLANFLIHKERKEELSDYLENRVFANQQGVTLVPDPEDEEGFERYTERYKRGLPIVRQAVKDMA